MKITWTQVFEIFSLWEQRTAPRFLNIVADINSRFLNISVQTLKRITLTWTSISTTEICFSSNSFRYMNTLSSDYVSNIHILWNIINIDCVWLIKFQFSIIPIWTEKFYCCSIQAIVFYCSETLVLCWLHFSLEFYKL